MFYCIDVIRQLIINNHCSSCVDVLAKIGLIYNIKSLCHHYNNLIDVNEYISKKDIYLLKKEYCVIPLKILKHHYRNKSYNSYIYRCILKKNNYVNNAKTLLVDLLSLNISEKTLYSLLDIILDKNNDIDFINSIDFTKVRANANRISVIEYILGNKKFHVSKEFYIKNIKYFNIDQIEKYICDQYDEKNVSFFYDRETYKNISCVKNVGTICQHFMEYIKQLQLFIDIKQT